MSKLAYSRALALLLAFASLTVAQEKRLAVISPQGAFSVTVIERDGKDYISLLDLLQPLGAALARHDGDKWKLRFESADAEFKQGRAKAKVRGKNVDLSAPFLLDDTRGLVPVHALPGVLGRLLSQPFDFREAGRRLIFGPLTAFSASLENGAPPQLVLHFSAPVNPSVATEPGRLRLVFTREPVVATPATESFDDKIITSATYAENNGAAEITVSAAVPLMANFSDNGRTVTIVPAPRREASRVPAAPPMPPVVVQTPGAPGVAPGAAQPGTRPRFLVVIDPAHGGDDPGARLSASIAEKDLTLAWARRLQAALEKNGVASLLLRDGDITLALDQRAVAANAARAAAFISLHVDTTGSGVRLFTARLSDNGAKAGAVLPWGAAQSAYLDSSRALAGSIATELTKHDVQHASATALLRPLNNIAGSAIAIEIVPPGHELGTAGSLQYQQLVCGAIADGISGARASILSGSPGRIARGGPQP